MKHFKGSDTVKMVGFIIWVQDIPINGLESMSAIAERLNVCDCIISHVLYKKIKSKNYVIRRAVLDRNGRKEMCDLIEGS